MVLTTQWTELEQLGATADAESWRWFIDRYRGFVASVLRRFIWAPDRAAEASEQFWGYLFTSGALNRVGRRMRFRGYLVSTLHHYALDWIRRNPRVAQENPPECIDSSIALPEDQEVALWSRQLLLLAMQQLESEQANQAHALRAVYGLATTVDAEVGTPRRATEVANELGCTANALHQLMYRARERLRELLVAQVRQTVSGGRDFDAELATMLGAIGRASPGMLPGVPGSVS